MLLISSRRPNRLSSIQTFTLLYVWRADRLTGGHVSAELTVEGTSCHSESIASRAAFEAPDDRVTTMAPLCSVSWQVCINVMDRHLAFIRTHVSTSSLWDEETHALPRKPLPSFTLYILILYVLLMQFHLSYISPPNAFAHQSQLKLLTYKVKNASMQNLETWQVIA